MIRNDRVLRNRLFAFSFALLSSIYALCSIESRVTERLTSTSTQTSTSENIENAVIIDKEQVDDYAARRGLNEMEIRKMLGRNFNQM